MPLGAVALGASVVEKHFIMSRSQGGPDAAFSMQPAEFEEMVASIRYLEKAMGVATLELSAKAVKNRAFARSLYIVDDVQQGDVFTDVNVRSIRPSLGLAPKHYTDVLGKTAAQAVGRGTPLSWAHVDAVTGDAAPG